MSEFLQCLTRSAYVLVTSQTAHSSTNSISRVALTFTTRVEAVASHKEIVRFRMMLSVLFTTPERWAIISLLSIYGFFISLWRLMLPIQTDCTYAYTFNYTYAREQKKTICARVRILFVSNTIWNYFVITNIFRSRTFFCWTLTKRQSREVLLNLSALPTWRS